MCRFFSQVLSVMPACLLTSYPKPSLTLADVYLFPLSTHHLSSPFTYFLLGLFLIYYILSISSLPFPLSLVPHAHLRYVLFSLYSPISAHSQGSFLVDQRSPVRPRRILPSNCAIRLTLFIIPHPHRLFSPLPHSLDVLCATYPWCG